MVNVRRSHPGKPLRSSLSKPAEPSQTHVETNWGEAKVTTKGETRKVNPKKNENPVRVIVDNVVARRASRHRRRPTPRAMEPGTSIGAAPVTMSRQIRLDRQMTRVHLTRARVPNPQGQTRHQPPTAIMATHLREHRPPGQVGVIANARAVRGDVDTSPNGPRESRIERKERLTDA